MPFEGVWQIAQFFLQFATVDPVIVGRLHSDAREGQPHLLRTIGAVRAFFETDGSPGGPGS